jgi:hypothetical protein
LDSGSTSPRHCQRKEPRVEKAEKQKKKEQVTDLQKKQRRPVQSEGETGSTVRSVEMNRAEGETKEEEQLSGSNSCFNRQMQGSNQGTSNKQTN